MPMIEYRDRVTLEGRFNRESAVETRPVIRVTFDGGFSWYTTNFHMYSSSEMITGFDLASAMRHSMPSEALGTMVFENLVLDVPKTVTPIWYSVQRQRIHRLAQTDPVLTLEAGSMTTTTCVRAFMYCSGSGQRWKILGYLDQAKSEDGGVRAEVTLSDKKEYTEDHEIQDSELIDMIQ